MMPLSNLIARLRSRRPGALTRSARRVRLVEPGLRPPRTPVERLVVETLRRDGATPFDALVERVARQLYREARGNGAWVVDDIGLFGARLFLPDALRELAAGDGILWKIDAREEET